MSSLLDQPWPWWLGALALGLVAVSYTLVSGRSLGVSGHVGRALSGSGQSGQSALFLLGLVVGGAVAALAAGTLSPQGLDAVDATWARYFGGHGMAPAVAALFLGGLLVGAGTTLAGGCTSGHGLVGVARLQAGSIAATIAFFGVAVAVSFALARVFA
jgi:hypothetical protein